jgi:DNA-binding transcriptional regulator YiaG
MTYRGGKKGKATYEMHVALGQGEISNYIENLMARRHLRESQLAAYLGVDASTVCAWRQRRSVPSMHNCAKLARLDHRRPMDIQRLAGHHSSRTYTRARRRSSIRNDPSSLAIS